MLLVGYFEGLDSQRAIAWRCSDSLSLRAFLGIPLAEATPDHSSLTRIRQRLPLDAHEQVFAFVLAVAQEKGLLQGKTVAVDSTTLEANAAMRAHRPQGHRRGLQGVPEAADGRAGIENPTDEEARRFDRKRKKKGSNKEWESPADPDSRIAKMKDGRTHLAYKAEHAVDLDSGLVLAAAVHPADQGDQSTLVDSVLRAQVNLVRAGQRRRSRRRWPTRATTRLRDAGRVRADEHPDVHPRAEAEEADVGGQAGGVAAGDGGEPAAGQGRAEQAAPEEAERAGGAELRPRLRDGRGEADVATGPGGRDQAVRGAGGGVQPGRADAGAVRGGQAEDAPGGRRGVPLRLLLAVGAADGPPRPPGRADRTACVAGRRLTPEPHGPPKPAAFQRAARKGTMKTNGRRMRGVAVWLGVACVSLVAMSPLSAQQPKLRATLEGHKQQVFSVAYSPDGKTLASGSNDKTIKLWDVKTGKERATFEGHTEGVQSVAYSPDGKTLASGGEDKTIKLWDIKTGKERATLEGHRAWVKSVVYSPDGKTLASGSDDRKIKLWDAKTGKKLATLRGHTESVLSLAYSPDGKTLASGSWDKTIKLWDAKTGKELATLKGHTDWGVWSVAFSPDGKTLASGSGDKTIKLWDVKTGKELATLEGHIEEVSSVAFSPNGKRLASGGHDITIWDVRTGKEQATLKGHKGDVISVAYSPDGTTLASASTDKTIKLWVVRKAEEPDE